MRLFKLAGDIVVNGKEAVADLKQIEDQGQATASKLKKKFRSSMQTLGRYAKRGAAIGATAIAGMAASSINQFANFDEKMREVYTLIPDASEEMKRELSQDVRDVGEQYGFLADDTVPALYQALSAGVPPDNVMSFMDQAAQAAKAGVTDLQTSVDGLTSAVNAYGQDVLDAEKASDILFTTVKQGKTTFPELSKNMSNVTPIAASLGVEFEGINAALATMTAQGMDTGKATIYLRAMLNQLSKSGSDANDVFKEMAGQTFTEFIDSGNSLADALELMEQYAAENNTTIKKLFSNVRAGTGALQLTGSNMDTFIENMDEMESSAGSTEEAYGEMSESVQQTLDELRAWWQNQRIAIGEKLEEPLRDLLKFLENNEGKISELLQGTFQSLVDALKWIVNNKQKAVTSIQAIGAAFAGWKIAALVSNLWGLVAVLGVIGGLGIAKAVREIGKAMRESWGKDAVDRHKENIESIEGAVADHKETLGKLEETLKELKGQRDNYAEGKVPKWLKLEIEKIEGLIEDQKKLIKQYENSKRAEENQVEIKKEHEKANKNLIQTIKNLGRSEGNLSGDREERLKQLKSRLEELSNMRETMLQGGATPGELTPINKMINSIKKQIAILYKGDEAFENYGAAADTVDIKLGKLKGTTEEKTQATEEETEAVGDLYEGYQGTIGAREEEAEAIMDQLEAQSEALDIMEDTKASIKDEILLRETLGEEYDETEIRINHYEEAIRRLIDAGLEGTDTFEEMKDRLEELREEAKENETAMDRLADAWEENWQDMASSALDELDKVLNEGKDFADSLNDYIGDSLGDIGQMIGTAFGMPGVGRLAGEGAGILWDWLTSPGEADEENSDRWSEWLGLDEIEEGLKKVKNYKKLTKSIAENLSSGLKGAFSADTYEGFIDNFGTSIEEAVKSSMIKAFMATEAMKSKMKKLSGIIAKATSPDSPGGVSITESERASIKNMADKIVKRAKPLYDAISGLNLGPGETKTGSFGSAPSSSGNTSTVQTENITPEVIERLGDTVKDQGENIVKELEKQTDMLGSGDKTEVTLQLDKEVLARKIFELKNKRKRAMGVS